MFESMFTDHDDIEYAADRLTDGIYQTNDGDEFHLRPRTLAEYCGQTRVKENLRIFIAAALSRGEPLDHVLLYGPPGLGKTTLSGIIANELGVNLKVTSGPAIEKAGDLAAILTNLQEKDVLFIDEIHRLNRSVEEVYLSIKHLIDLLERFVVEKNQDFAALEVEEQNELLSLFANAPGDFKNLILGHYGKLPMGWPDEWVYKSAFGSEWKKAIGGRKEESPLDALPDEDLAEARKTLKEALGWEPNKEQFILYLMHPKDAVEYMQFREKFGQAPYVLPTNVWREGLKKYGDTVEFEINGKPFSIELVSIGEEHEGIIHVILRVNNKMRVYAVETPRVKTKKEEMATGPNEVGSPINGTVWRLGNPRRGSLKPGDIVHKGEEIANIEAMKMETAVLAPFDAQVVAIKVELNDIVKEGQLLFVLEPIEN